MDLGGVPPPPPPPPPPDLNAVYRPEEDPALNLLGTFLAREEEDVELLPPLTGFVFEPQPVIPISSSVLSLIDLGDSEGPPSESGIACLSEGSGGLLSRLPLGVPPAAALDAPSAFIDLSAPAPAAASRPAAGLGPRTAPSGAAPGPGPTIPDRRGFGSEDLFGRAPGADRSMQDEATSALNSIVGMLPNQVKQQFPTCMAAVHEDAETEEIMGPLGVPTFANGEEQRHAEIAVNRACEGRWVPTYMRRQLAEHGHTTLPQGANAHEFNASAPPATLGQAFVDMGSEIGETAQTMLTFVLAILSSLSIQCQMCSHAAASSAHDQVIAYGENLCGASVAGDNSEDLVVLGPLLSEADAGLGPMRSRVRRTLEDVSFLQLVDIARSKLVTPGAPPEFRRAVKSRLLQRRTNDAARQVEDWLFSTEVNPEAVPQNSVEHVCKSNGPMGFGPLIFREVWHVELQDARASVEISSAPAQGPVTVVLRVDITGLPDPSAPGLDVDGRLFARPREHGAVLPLGLVEELTEVHHVYSERLRDVALALAAETVGAGRPQVPAGDRAVLSPAAGAPDTRAPPPVVQWPFPEKRPPSWASEGPGLRSLGQAAPGAVNASMLLQVADGI